MLWYLRKKVGQLPLLDVIIMRDVWNILLNSEWGLVLPNAGVSLRPLWSQTRLFPVTYA